MTIDGVPRSKTGTTHGISDLAFELHRLTPGRLYNARRGADGPRLVKGWVWATWRDVFFPAHFRYNAFEVAAPSHTGRSFRLRHSHLAPVIVWLRDSSQSAPTRPEQSFGRATTTLTVGLARCEFLCHRATRTPSAGKGKTGGAGIAPYTMLRVFHVLTHH